jgi:hypothetical protein
VDRFDASNECFSDGDCPADRRFCRQETAEQRWTCFATLAQVGQFCVDPDDCNGRRCIGNQCRSPDQNAEEGGIGETDRAELLQALLDNLEVITDVVRSLSQEALNRIKAAILPDIGDLDVEQFLHLAQLKKARAVAIVKSGDKMILAKRENGAIDRAAISTIKYQHIDINVCQKIVRNLAENDRERVNCRKDPDTGSNFVKTTTSNTELWHQLISQLQLR